MTTEKTIKTIRQDLGLTQQEVADKIGISITSYNQIEQGKMVARLETWKRLQDVLNINDSEMWQLINNTRA